MYAIFMKSEMTIQNLPLLVQQLFLRQIFKLQSKYIVRSFALHPFEKSKTFLSTCSPEQALLKKSLKLFFTI